MLILLVLLFSSTFAADIANSQPDTHESNAVGLKTGASSSSTKQPVVGVEETRQWNFNALGNFGGSTNRRRCPLCDSSVFPYCGDKLFHDACCCTDPYQFPLPYKCEYADCAFLHANSCREHALIAGCCCTDEYRSLVRNSGKSDVGVAGAEKKKN